MHPPSVPILSKICLVHPSHPTYSITTLIWYSQLWLDLASGLYPSGLTINALYAPLLSYLRAICPTQHFVLDSITRIIFAEEYWSLSSSLCNLLHSPVTSSFVGPNTFLNTIISHTLNRHLCSVPSTHIPQCERPSFTLNQKMQIYSYVDPNLYIFE
jgi:hypothetical protein